MPAAAVIPAPIAYIKVVAVKKLVVGFLTAQTSLSKPSAFLPSGEVCGGRWVGNDAVSSSRRRHVLLIGCVSRIRDLYFEKIRVFKAGLRLNTLAWNNKIGLWFCFVGL